MRNEQLRPLFVEGLSTALAVSWRSLTGTTRMDYGTSPLSQRLSGLRPDGPLWAPSLSRGFWLGDMDGLEVGEFGPETGDRAATDRNDGINENYVKGFQGIQMCEAVLRYPAVVNGQTVESAHVGKMKQSVICQVRTTCDLKVFQFRQRSQVLEATVSDAGADKTQIFYVCQSG